MSVTKRIITPVFLVTLLLAVVMLPASVRAATASKTTTTTKSSSTTTDTTKTVDISSGVAQSYNAGTDVQIGMIVQQKKSDTSTVVPLTLKDIKNMLGVAIPNTNAAIIIAPPSVKQQQVLVARSGSFDVLVSNQSGTIKKGDTITISAVDGVAMKAGTDQELILGRASANFNGSQNVVGSVQLKDAQKNNVTVSIGRIPVDINISHNPSFQKKSDAVPAFLSKISTTIAAKPVSAARIYMGLVILIITMVITSNVMYGGIRGGMIAVGRNPLSKKSIIKSLIQTVMGGLIIFVAGVFAVYLILKL